MNLGRLFFVGLLMLGWAGVLRGDEEGTPGQSTHRMGAIGVVVSNDAGNAARIHEYMIVRRLVDRSPAMKGGLQVGDEILAIDETRLAGRNFVDAVNSRLRGEPQSLVTLTVRRAGHAKPMTFSFIRTIVPTEGDGIRRA